MNSHLDELNTAHNWSRPESLCTCDNGNDDELFDYLVRKYTTSQINAKLKNARRSSGYSSRSGSSTRSASSSILSSLTSSSRRRFSRCSVHSSTSNLRRTHHETELSSCIEEPHPGTKVNIDIPPARPIGTPTSVPASSHSHHTTTTLNSTGAGSHPAKQNNPSKQYLCPFCAEHDIENGISRESDLVKHFRTYHNTNALWTCRKAGCGKAFDLQSAYKQHLNSPTHPPGPIAPGNARVLLQNQVVFACGFEGCKQIYEVDPMDLDTAQTSKEYFAHVILHMKRFIHRKAPCPWEEPPVWSYSTRLRNLMRQSQVKNFWKDLAKDDRGKLKWGVAETTVLRKKLECRDVKDARVLVQVAQELGVASTRRLSWNRKSGGSGNNSSHPRSALAQTLTLPMLEYAGGVQVDEKPQPSELETSYLDDHHTPGPGSHLQSPDAMSAFSNTIYSGIGTPDPSIHQAPSFTDLSHTLSYSSHDVPAHAAPGPGPQPWETGSHPQDLSSVSAAYFTPPPSDPLDALNDIDSVHAHHAMWEAAAAQLHGGHQDYHAHAHPHIHAHHPASYTSAPATNGQFDINSTAMYANSGMVLGKGIQVVQTQWYSDRDDVSMRGCSPPR